INCRYCKIRERSVSLNCSSRERAVTLATNCKSPVSRIAYNAPLGEDIWTSRFCFYFAFVSDSCPTMACAFCAEGVKHGRHWKQPTQLKKNARRSFSLQAH